MRGDGTWPGIGDLGLENPSLSIGTLMERLVLNEVVLALVPNTLEVQEFAAWLQLQAPGTEDACSSTHQRPNLRSLSAVLGTKTSRERRWLSRLLSYLTK